MMPTKTQAPEARLQKAYRETYRPELVAELGLANLHQAPRLEKVVINVGLGRAKDDKALFETASNTLRKITGQQPVATYSKRAIAGFKLREGVKIGLKVTLRGERMYEFVDRLVNIVLPRLRDFHGLKVKAFDAQGNYSLGLIDQTVFPELTFEEVAKPHGLQVIFGIDSRNAEHSRALLTKLGVPFEKPLDQTRGKERNQ